MDVPGSSTGCAFYEDGDALTPTRRRLLRRTTSPLGGEVKYGRPGQ